MFSALFTGLCAFCVTIQRIVMYLPSGLGSSLKVGREMKVCDTECVGSRTQAMLLG